jgi:hypothetical protein
VPSAADVAKARAQADATAREVADISARLDAAEARLEALQVRVASAVSAHEEAVQALADAEDAARRAALALASARAVQDDADRSLRGQAALIYMQGSDLQNLTTMLLTPPNAMSDLALVLDDNARTVRDTLDRATAAAGDAATRETLLTSARDARAQALAAAEAARATAEREAAAASAEAARLGAEQEKLSARLAELEQGATDMAVRRAAATGSGLADLLGLQTDRTLAAGPRAAQAIAKKAVADHGWDAAEFGCLVVLWQAESGWSWSATNPSSGAYGIPQSLPGWKMASAGPDWLTNPATQIAWGLGYIETAYGSPCHALDAFSSRSPHWY